MWSVNFCKEEEEIGKNKISEVLWEKKHIWILIDFTIHVGLWGFQLWAEYIVVDTILKNGQILSYLTAGKKCLFLFSKIYLI